jgi:hypothetical protein
MFDSIAQLAQLFGSQEPMESARGIGRQAVDFDAAESAFFQLDFEPYLFLTSDQKRSCITEEDCGRQGVNFYPETDETGDKLVDRAFE